MRPGVSAALASESHQLAFKVSEMRHEEKAARALDRTMRRFVRGAVSSFVSHRLVLVAAAGDPPEWRMPLPRDLMDQVAAQAELERVAKIHSDDVATSTMQEMGGSLGMTPDQWQPLLRGVIAAQAGMKIVTAPEEIVTTMMQSLQGSYEAGHSIPKAAREMRKAGYDRSRYFAERIARTELIGAVNASSLAAVTAGTDIPYKLWMSTNDQRTRPTHRAADGQTVPIDAAFSVGGFRLEYPGDPSGPGEEVIMCRCTMGYVDEPRGLSTIAGGGRMATVEATDDVAVGAVWEGPLAFEGVDTGDGRIITAGALNWRELPIPLMAQTTTAHGFGDPGPAEIAGRIDTIERAGDSINGGGIFDTSDSAMEAERLVREGILTGISLDLAINEAEIIPPEDPVDEIEAMFGGTLNVLDGTILGATIVPFPAFENARIAIVAGAAMHMRNVRREDDRMVATIVMPFAPFPAAGGPPAAGGGDDETDPADATDDAAEAISDITDAVNGWPGLNGQVVITIDGEDTTVAFPPATASGDEPAEDAAAATIEHIDNQFAALRLALRQAAKHGVIK